MNSAPKKCTKFCRSEFPRRLQTLPPSGPPRVTCFSATSDKHIPKECGKLMAFRKPSNLEKKGFSRSRSDVYPRVVIQMCGDVWWMFLLFLKYCWWWHVNIWCLPVFCMYVFLCSKFPDFLWTYHGNILNPKPLMWTLRRYSLADCRSSVPSHAAGHRSFERLPSQQLPPWRHGRRCHIL